MQPNEPLPDFGEPLDLDELLLLAEIDEEDIEDALDWFDENASPDWIGALDSTDT